ncbi:hypothetical protein F2Q69_00037536 [Brassica cretica]|uniref:Uncharacterized protein n=1 Tax=Brassica cretica TaxID=69181 RepID=A0A8S9SLR6_BRACR|nr:hypothetical protein F2Q69_00037536 [Brassica cretica]
MVYGLVVARCYKCSMIWGFEGPKRQWEPIKISDPKHEDNYLNLFCSMNSFAGLRFQPKDVQQDATDACEMDQPILSKDPTTDQTKSCPCFPPLYANE